MTLQGAYQYEQFDDEDEEDNSTKVHDFIGRAEIMPLPDFILFAEGGLNYLLKNNKVTTLKGPLWDLVGLKERSTAISSWMGALSTGYIMT